MALRFSAAGALAVKQRLFSHGRCSWQRTAWHGTTIEPSFIITAVVARLNCGLCGRTSLWLVNLTYRLIIISHYGWLFTYPS